MDDRNLTSLEIIAKEFTKDISLPDLKPNILMEDIFGRGRLGNVVSFGGSTFGDNSAKVDRAIENTFEMQRVWNRSHSQWTWKHINLGFHHDWLNFRQLCAEVAGRREALTEAKWRHIENEIKIRRQEEELARMRAAYDDPQETYPDLKWDIAELEVDIARLREGIISGMTYIEGAMKDILTLNEIYEKQFKPKYENYTEEDYERNNAELHIMRAVVQSLRDVRQFGVITKGEQEYLEQIGLNPSKVQYDLQKYLVEVEHARGELDKADPTVVTLHRWVREYTKHLSHIPGIKAEFLGYDEDPNPEFLFIEPAAKES